MAEAWLECVACRAQYALWPVFTACARCRERGSKAPVEVR